MRLSAGLIIAMCALPIACRQLGLVSVTNGAKCLRSCAKLYLEAYSDSGRRCLRRRRVQIGYKYISIVSEWFVLSRKQSELSSAVIFNKQKTIHNSLHIISNQTHPSTRPLNPLAVLCGEIMQDPTDLFGDGRNRMALDFAVSAQHEFGTDTHTHTTRTQFSNKQQSKYFAHVRNGDIGVCDN